jgi:hypothetical protein
VRGERGGGDAVLRRRGRQVLRLDVPLDRDGIVLTFHEPVGVAELKSVFVSTEP